MLKKILDDLVSGFVFSYSEVCVDDFHHLVSIVFVDSFGGFLALVSPLHFLDEFFRVPSRFRECSI